MNKTILSIIAASAAAVGAAASTAALMPERTLPVSGLREEPTSMTDAPERRALPVADSSRRMPVRKAPAATAGADIPDICGQLTYMAGGTGAEYGFYILPKSSSDKFTGLGYTPWRLEYGGYHDPAKGIYRGVYAPTPTSAQTSVISYYTDTWEVAQKTDLSDAEGLMMRATSMALDPSTGDVYGFFYDETGEATVWGKADFDHNTRTSIAKFPITEAFSALVATPQGEFYGIDLNGSLMTIDKGTGAVAELASTDLPILYSFGACYDPENECIYATSNADDFGSGLYAISVPGGETERPLDGRCLRLLLRRDRRGHSVGKG